MSGKPSNTGAGIRIRSGKEHDLPTILRFIQLLAEYERLADKVVATEEILREEMFGDRPSAESVIAFSGDTPVGFALFFHNFSTFHARKGLYLEDLFVLEDHRGRGIGKMLITHLAKVAVERNCSRFEWAVLDWNEPAIQFYRSLGAEPQNDWTVYRVSGKALKDLAHSSDK